MADDSKATFESELKPGKFVVPSGRWAVKLAAGSLEIRQAVNKSSAVFFWRVNVGHVTHRFKIGAWDGTAPPKQTTPTRKGFGLVAAARAAEAMAAIHSSAEWAKAGGYPAKVAHDEAEQAETARQAEAARLAAAIQAEADRAAKAEAERARADAETRQKEYSLEKLIEAYCDLLKAQDKQSKYDARNLLNRRVVKAHPDLAAKPACDVTDEELADVLRKINEEGHARTANKARSYLKAAYQLAVKAKTNAAVPLKFKEFGVKVNPLLGVDVIKGGNRTDKDPLKDEAFVEYWRSIEKLPGLPGHMLRLHLLTGGQRIAQLCRLTRADVADRVMTLWDGKGKRDEPRRHDIPLTKAAQVEIDALLKINTDEAGHLISTDKGKTEAWPSTISGFAKDAYGKKDFQLKRIRSGVETLLASRGISREVRAQLQSHGISGVQASSYDGHSYQPEKLHALEVLYRALAQKESAKVVTLRQA